MELTEKMVAIIGVTIGSVTLTVYGRPELAANCIIGMLAYLFGERNGYKKGTAQPMVVKNE